MAPRKSIGRRQKAGKHAVRDEASHGVQISQPDAISSGLAHKPISFFDESYVNSIDISQMPALIERFMQADAVDHQTQVISCCLQRILDITHPNKNYQPHFLQVSALRRLIFGIGDTLLIARTGFGKSIILHAYSIMTGFTTLQITPLNKLGEEQVQAISQIPLTTPCLLNSETKRTDRDVLENIRANTYSHIVLSPEQALSKNFRDILLSPAVQAKIGLVAVDECHLVAQWKQFRENYSNLHVLRQCLRSDVVWFGCSATMSENDEDQILRNGGFRSIGSGTHRSAIIRGSIDRPDIYLSFHPIPRNLLKSFAPLLFLLRSTDSGACSPSSIPKTIVFINNISRTHEACEYFRDWLVSNGNYDNELARRTVRLYNSRVAVVDQALEFEEFVSPTSEIRIMVATTSLGMGINVPDIERVIVYDFPQDRSVQDTWQRIGRGGRGENRTSHAFVFLPYWVFDSEGYEMVAGAVDRRGGTKRQRIDISESSRTNEGGDNQPTAKPWTKDERERRNELPVIWRDIVNGQCHRKPFLKYLGEEKVSASQKTVIAKELCCGRCNSSSYPTLPSLPANAPTTTKTPRKNTREFFALERIRKWCKDNAEMMCQHPGRRFPRPSTLFMKTPCQIELAMLFKSKKDIADLNIDLVKERAPQLANWKYMETKGQDLMAFLSTLAHEVDTLHHDHLRVQREQSEQHFNKVEGTQPYTEEHGDRLARLAVLHRQAIRERGNAPIVASSRPI